MMDSELFSEIASREGRCIVPNADALRTQIVAQAKNQVVTIVEPVVDGRMLAPIQILLLAVDGQWIAWQAGEYGEWMEVEGGTGVVIRSFRVDSEATSVLFSDQLSKVLDVGNERRAHAVLWSVPRGGPWLWPTVEEIQLNDIRQRPASPRLPVTSEYLIGEYISGLIDEGGWAWEALADLIDQYPTLALETIVRAINEAHDEEILSRIGAGHLESLVRHHGDSLDEALATAAALSPAVRLALLSVWTPLPPRTAAASGAMRH